ncbi:MAG: hypothetical protein H5U17_17875 [Defluviimonas sp.]|nr:hypothetical protein [Defluviimonas sp.]
MDWCSVLVGLPVHTIDLKPQPVADCRRITGGIGRAEERVCDPAPNRQQAIGGIGPKEDVVLRILDQGNAAAGDQSANIALDICDRSDRQVRAGDAGVLAWICAAFLAAKTTQISTTRCSSVA